MDGGSGMAAAGRIVRIQMPYGHMDIGVIMALIMCGSAPDGTEKPWLFKPVIPRRQWPKPVFKDKRVITPEEHVHHRTGTKRGTNSKPILFRFSADIEAVLKRRPAERPTKAGNWLSHAVIREWIR